MKLDETVAAVVTGGASGLGRATARKLAECGSRVALFDLDPERGEAAAREIGGMFCAVDVTSDASVAAGLAAARERHGGERVLVNCAGIATGRKTVSRDRATGALVRHGMEPFRAAIEINLVGTYRMIAASAAAMAGLDPATADGVRGVVVNTASIAATDGQVGQAAYAASKAGVVGLTLPVARDLAAYGIRVVTIMPGLFSTPMLEGLPGEVQTSLATTVPFPARLGRPEEYARLVAAIIDNDMLNGEAIRLDGALRMAPK